MCIRDSLKGLGGFHLACDARHPAAVARLRQRKQRDEKPFAVMLANGASAQAWVSAGPDDLALLAAPERPIVLLPRQAGRTEALPGVAPGLHTLGVMLPCTPCLLYTSPGPGHGLRAAPCPRPLATPARA